MVNGYASLLVGLDRSVCDIMAFTFNKEPGGLDLDTPHQQGQASAGQRNTAASQACGPGSSLLCVGDLADFVRVFCMILLVIIFVGATPGHNQFVGLFANKGCKTMQN